MPTIQLGTVEIPTEKFGRTIKGYNLIGFPHAKNNRGGNWNISKQKTLRIKIASEADFYDPHVLTRGSKKRVFLCPNVPAAEQSYECCCQPCQVKRSASPGPRRASAK